MKSLITIVLLISFKLVLAQKPVISDTSYKIWPSVRPIALSNNGKFAYYEIDNLPVGQKTSVVAATDHYWELRTSRLNNITFNTAGNKLYAIQGKDSLIEMNLETKKKNYLDNCKTFKLESYKGIQWLVYQKSNGDSSVVFKNIHNNKMQVVKNVLQLSFVSNTAKVILKQRRSVTEGEGAYLYDIFNNTKIKFSSSHNISDIILDKSETKIAFIKKTDGVKSIWYFNSRLDSAARQVATDQSKGIITGYSIATTYTWKFSDTGNDLLFTLDPRPQDRKVNKIWNYQDVYLLSEYEQNSGSINRGENLCKLSLQSGLIVPLLSGHRKVIGKSQRTDVMLVLSNYGRTGDIPLNSITDFEYFLLFPESCKLISLGKYKNSLPEIELSPNREQVVYFDPDKKCYVAFNYVSHELKVIGKDITDNFYTYGEENRGNDEISVGGIIGWDKEKDLILIQSRYDIWQVSIGEAKLSLCLTRGIGKSTSTIYFPYKRKPKLEDNEFLVLGFLLRTKEQSINTLNIRTGKFLEKYKTRNYITTPYRGVGQEIIKAGAADAYLLQTQNVSSLPNVVFTKDFKKVISLTDIHPEKQSIWLTSELLSYKARNGKQYESILYKPENFNPNRKYPVIFEYYIEATQKVNKYLDPNPSSDGINIPLLVSNGYIVCKPNIYLDDRRTGESALESIEAAANYISGFSWSESSKMAITGHSFAGWITNYIVTHSQKFTAAISGAGVSNLTADYNETWTDIGLSHQIYYKSGPYRFIDGLENAKAMYVENSPIFSTSNVTTPLLLIHNDNDNAVAVYQSHHLFRQLRSEGKPVWLLQYEGEKHTLEKEENQLDAERKVISFFDYYLKDKPIPNWMNNPIN